MTIQKMSQRLDILTCMVPRSINLVYNSEASCFLCESIYLYVFKRIGLLGEGGLHTKVLNKTQWQRNTGNFYLILNLDHVSVAYSAANIHAVAHATF